MNGQSKNFKDWVGFSFDTNIDRAHLGRLDSYLGSFENAWWAVVAEFIRVGLDATSVRPVVDWWPRVGHDGEIERLELNGVSVFTWHDDGYPARLRGMQDYPPIIHATRTILPDDEWCLGLFGTHRSSVYARQVTVENATELACNRITIASGLERGIDASAYRAALGAGDGRSPFATTGSTLSTPTNIYRWCKASSSTAP